MPGLVLPATIAGARVEPVGPRGGRRAAQLGVVLLDFKWGIRSPFKNGGRTTCLRAGLDGLLPPRTLKSGTKRPFFAAHLYDGFRCITCPRLATHSCHTLPARRSPESVVCHKVAFVDHLLVPKSFDLRLRDLCRRPCRSRKRPFNERELVSLCSKYVLWALTHSYPSASNEY